MWQVERTLRFARRLRKLEKKHRQEVAAVFDNLNTYEVALNQGVNPMQMVKQSFVHNEQMGVHAIDQSPLKRGFKELRLYVYPDTDTSTLHVITIGGKGQQSADVNECCDYVRQLQNEKDRQKEDEAEST